jgi:hypothetical protein
MSTVSKGNYYRLKTKKFYEADGYEVVTSEIRKPMPIKGKLIWISVDIFASDLIAMNGEDMLFIQVKANRGDVSKAVKEFEKHKFPPASIVRRMVVWWPERAKAPEVFEVQ